MSIDDRRILNCGKKTTRVSLPLLRDCSVRWGELEVTAEPRIRMCTLCSSRVYLVANSIEAGIRAEKGQCLAVPGAVYDAVEKRRDELAPMGGLTIGKFNPRSFFDKCAIESEVREYRARVWVNDGEWIQEDTVMATDLGHARKILQDKHGDNCRFSIWNEDDSQLPRK